MSDNPPGMSLPASSQEGTRGRFERTISFVESSLSPPATILDLGRDNPLAERLRQRGFSVSNTNGDLDFHPVEAAQDVEAVTAFEILEHLVAPFNVLRAIEAPRLFATVPLRLWFSSAYRNENDPWDRHFHEFEDWQFDWLIEKAGWSIVRKERWIPTAKGVPGGIRPLLRRFTPRWYAVEATRIDLQGI